MDKLDQQAGGRQKTMAGGNLREAHIGLQHSWGWHTVKNFQKMLLDLDLTSARSLRGSINQHLD